MQNSAGITTRSKAQVAPNQWTKIPLPAKVTRPFIFQAPSTFHIDGSIDVNCYMCFIGTSWQTLSHFELKLLSS
jgi:hypothetical protein